MNRFFRNSFPQKGFPDNFPATRERVLQRGCGSLSEKSKRSRLGSRIKGSDSSIERNIGYHGCPGQYGTTTIPLALSALIFCKTLPIMIKGGNA